MTRVSSWDEALALLDRYPWPLLYPLQVHTEFKAAVFAAIETHERGGPGQVERWRDTLDDLLEHCEAIADASGGLFGFGRVSSEERATLERITNEITSRQK